MGIENEKMRAFASLLSSQGQALGLIGPKESERVWTRHIENCATLAPFIENAGAKSVVDVGSGAGLPGIVLAILFPSVRFSLLEPRSLRKNWLDRMKKELELENADIFKLKAEQWKGGRFDAAVCRALAPLSSLYPLLSPLVRDGGRIFALKGKNAAEEMKSISSAELFRVRQEGGEETSVVSVSVRRR